MRLWQPPDMTARRQRVFREMRARIAGRSALLTRTSVKIAERTFRGNFDSIRVANKPPPTVCQTPQLVVYYNHASWWDGILYLILTDRLFRGRAAYIPIHAAMLQRYPLANRVGAFGVARGSLCGALQFLEGCRAILAGAGNVLFVTPQGRFADCRERPLQLEAGIAHISRVAPQATYLPLAVEYTYWAERKPELLLRFGNPICAAEVTGLGVTARLAVLEKELTNTMDRLMHDSTSRDHSAFEVLMDGKRGIHPAYDAWRRLSSFRRGRPYSPGHGSR